MTYKEFKDQLESFRRDADAVAWATKDSQLALDRLRSLYFKFDSSEQSMARQVLADWALSGDEGMRFDAVALIDDLRITQAIPALHELARRLEKSDVRGAQFELAKVQRIVADLE